jgi:plastocyanin
VVYGGLVYVGTGGLTPTMDSWMYAFDADTGIEVWSHGLADYSTSSPAYANGVVYVGSFSHQLYGFDARTGAKLWDSGFTAMGGGIPSSPAVANGFVYVGSLDGSLYAFTDTPGPPISTLVTISDFQFDPTDALNHKLGNKVQWTNLGLSMHTVTDDSGMGLFDSGLMLPGSAFTFTFMGAGIYKYSCTRYPSMTGTIKAPMVLSPDSGDLSTTFTIQWAGGKAPAGYVYDVQIWRPRASDWVNWMTDQTIASSTFVPDAGRGTYQFRARFTNTANGNSSSYSAAKNIDVS